MKGLRIRNEATLVLQLYQPAPERTLALRLPPHPKSTLNPGPESRKVVHLLGLLTAHTFFSPLLPIPPTVPWVPEGGGKAPKRIVINWFCFHRKYHYLECLIHLFIYFVQDEEERVWWIDWDERRHGSGRTCGKPNEKSLTNHLSDLFILKTWKILRKNRAAGIGCPDSNDTTKLQ